MNLPCDGKTPDACAVLAAVTMATTLTLAFNQTEISLRDDISSPFFDAAVRGAGYFTIDASQSVAAPRRSLSTTATFDKHHLLTTFAVLRVNSNRRKNNTLWRTQVDAMLIPPPNKRESSDVCE
jgi:hypothetical protein